MTSYPELTEQTQNFPSQSGVYLMYGDNDVVLYIGKAKSLKNRIKSYFLRETDGRYQVSFLLRRVKKINYIVTTNEKEALLLENELIKKHKPKYNIHLKDDKSYLSIKIDTTHDYPRVLVTRNIKKDGALYFGPYSSADALRTTQEYFQTIFKTRTCNDFEFTKRKRPCLEYEIKRCTAPCVGLVSKEEYAENVAAIICLLQGKDQELLEHLNEKMMAHAANEEFEKAAALRDMIQQVSVTLEKQKVIIHGGVHQDLIALYREGERILLSLFVVREGRLIDTKYFPLTSFEEEAEVVLEFIQQYYEKTPFIPDEILVSVPGIASSEGETLEKVLREKKGKKIVIRNPKLGEKKELLELAYQNAISQFKKLVKKEFDAVEILQRLQTQLSLMHLPIRMECYDISNISGQMATASGVVFMNGEPDKSQYRKYKIKIDGSPNDYAMMYEVLHRRLKGSQSTDADYPQLIILDGGKGQLGIGMRILEELQIKDIDLISIAKGQGEGARSKGLWNQKKEEEIYKPNQKNPILLKRGSAELMLLQRIRDESHRFAINYHRLLRLKKIQQSELDIIPGLGPKKKIELLKKFSSVEKIKKLSVEELTQVKGINQNLAVMILRVLNSV